MQRKVAKTRRRKGVLQEKKIILNKPERDRNSFSRCQAEPGDGNNAFRRDGRNIPATFRLNSGGIPPEFRQRFGGVPGRELLKPHDTDSMDASRCTDRRSES